MKSEWKDVPDWVQWIAQDADGEWNGYDIKPEISASFDEFCREDLTVFNRGKFITLERDGPNHSWKDSLEKRPDSDELMTCYVDEYGSFTFSITTR